MDLLHSNVPTLSELLAAPVMHLITDQCTWRRYEPGRLIHRRGDHTPGFSLIRAGHVDANNIGLDGSTVTTSILGPGHSFGEFTLFAGLPRTHNMVALDEVEIGTIAEKAFLKLAETQPSIISAMLTIALRGSYYLMEFLDSQRRLPLVVRVAQVLLNQIRHNNQQRIDCKHEELAFTLGVTRVSIAKALSQLEQTGLIERGYGHITIGDKAMLAAWISDRHLVLPLSLHHQSKGSV